MVRIAFISSHLDISPPTSRKTGPSRSYPRPGTHSRASIEPFVTDTIADPAISNAIASTASPGAFGPVLDIPAFLSFALIVSVFALLQIRTNSIASAVQRRKEALDDLRGLKAKELDERVDMDEVAEALENYRAAMQEVEDLRTVIPGFARIAFPRGSRTEEDNSSAAKQFLGVELDTPDPENEAPGSGNDESSPTANLGKLNATAPLAAAATLVLLGAFQIGVSLLLLSDPTSTNGFITQMSSGPPMITF